MAKFKTPSDVLDYFVDYSEWLGTDTIATSVWDVPTDMTKVSDSHTDTVSTVFVDGGLVGITYDLVNTIETVGGRTKSAAVTVVIREV